MDAKEKKVLVERTYRWLIYFRVNLDCKIEMMPNGSCRVGERVVDGKFCSGLTLETPQGISKRSFFTLLLEGNCLVDIFVDEAGEEYVRLSLEDENGNGNGKNRNGGKNNLIPLKYVGTIEKRSYLSTHPKGKKEKE